jgi:hypothetical protein
MILKKTSQGEEFIPIGIPSILKNTFIKLKKFRPVVPEICRGQVHVPKKERRKRIITRYDYNLTIMKSQVSQTGH